MGWIDVPADPASGAVCTVNKKDRLITLQVGRGLLKKLQWDEDTDVKVLVGTDENAGWVQVTELDGDRTLAAGEDGAVAITMPLSFVPDAATCRALPVLARVVEECLHIQVPLAQPKAGKQPMVRGRPQLRAVGPVEPPKPHNIAVPAELADLHKQWWAADLEVVFYSDGTAQINGASCPADEVRSRASAILRARQAS